MTTIRSGKEEKSISVRSGRSLTLAGLGFAFLEVLKQAYLIRNVFTSGYDVWYLPFQLCSMPIYLCLICGIPSALGKTKALSGLRTVMLTFLTYYGLLGGVMALIVRDGFTFSEHPLLTAHGWVWHLGMVALAVLIYAKDLGDRSLMGYVRTIPLFLTLSAAAEAINVAFHTMGDCDMFYISPYHLSSQPVFCDIDAAVGRPAGIAIYLAAVCFGAFLGFLLFKITDALRKR